MTIEDIDIFSEGGTVPPPPMRLRYEPAPKFDQVIQFQQDPEGFNSLESRAKRYEEGRIDIERKKASGAYGSGDSFDREAYENDFTKLNEAYEMGMPARIFPAFMPYTAQEADMAAEVSFYGGVPTMEEQIVTQSNIGEEMLEKNIEAIDPMGSRVAGLQEGIGSLLGRLGGGSEGKQFILRKEGKKPEIKLFKKEGSRGMPDQTGIQFTRRF